MRKSLSLLVVLTLFLIAAAVPTASAMEIDNVKNSKDIPAGGNFNLNGKAIEHNLIWNDYAPIEIKNMFGFGKVLFQGAITQHDEACGIECESTMEIYLGEDSVLIDSVDFYTIKSDGSRVKQDVRSYQFYVDNIPYELGTEMPSGFYEVRLEAEKKPSRAVDWVIKSQGETLIEWAVWDGIYTAYDEIDDSSINASLWDYTGHIQSGVIFGYVVEDTEKIRLYGDLDTSSVGTRTETLSSNNLSTDFSGIDSASMHVLLSANSDSRSGGYGRLMFFGNIIKQITTSGSDNSVWLFIKNTSSGSLQFDVYDDGVYDSTITPAGNGILLTAYQTADSSSLYSFGEASIYNVYYNVSNIILNSPADNYISSINDVEFNCSTQSPTGVTLTNMSIWHNKTGVFISNKTNLITGTENSTTFNITLEDEDTVDWTCSVGVSDGDSGFGENRTISIDTSAPTINITYPVTSFDYGYVGENLSLNWTVLDTNLETCWYNYNNTNTTVTCTDQNASFILTDQRNITFYANDSVSNEGNFTRTWTYKLFGNLEIYNSTTYETATEGFKINITSDGSELVLADLVYDGTAYTGTKVGNNSEMEFNRNLIIPEIDIATAQNKSFYWNITYGSEVIPTETNNQSAERIALGLCNSTLTVPYINFTFEDEETTLSTNASIDTSTWTYNLGSGDGSVNKTLLYSTTAANESFGFCFSPSDKTMDTVLELQYSDTGYPQRRWSTSGSLTNATTEPTLYMLADADGTYSVYQVQDTVGNGIQGVEVKAERQFAGVWTLVEQGTTDSAGGFTGWLNPDYDHRITFTKSGYTTIQVTVRPSSSTYTVVMSSGIEDASYNSSEEGLLWKVYPDLGQTLFPNETQIFLFNITANLTNLVSCKMEVVNNNSVSLGTTVGCNSEGGNLSLAIPLGHNRSVRAIYSANIGDGYFILDADAYWIVMDTNIPERGTLTSFFKYSRELNEFGSDDNRKEFSRIIFFFLMLAIVMAFLSKNTGWDLITVGGSLVFMNFIIIFGSYGGFLTLSYTGDPPNLFMNQYVVALITSLFTGGYVLNKMARET